MENSASLEQQCEPLLNQVRCVNLSEKMNILGIQKQGTCFVFDFFSHRIVFDGHDFFTNDNMELTPALRVLFCQYILMCPENELKSDGKLVTFREFANAGPLFARFAANTGKIIQTSFSGRTDLLKQQCLKIGGMILDHRAYDLSVRFRAFAKIPIILNFNDADEMMPATAGFLYHETAASYLNIKSLGTTCTYLTGCLIQNL